MDYLIVFFGGATVGGLVTLAWTAWTRLAAIERALNEPKLPDHSVHAQAGTSHIANPYAQGEAARAEYKERNRTMWGPKGDEQGK